MWGLEFHWVEKCYFLNYYLYLKSVRFEEVKLLIHFPPTHPHRMNLHLVLELIYRRFPLESEMFHRFSLCLLLQYFNVFSVFNVLNII